MLHMPPTKVLISYTAQKHKIKTRATQKSLPFGKWRFRENVLGRMGQRQNRIRQKEQHDYAEEQKRRYIWDQDESPEIPDRGGGRGLRNPQSPFGGPACSVLVWLMAVIGVATSLTISHDGPGPILPRSPHGAELRPRQRARSQFPNSTCTTSH